MSEPSFLDYTKVASRFNQAASHYDKAAILQREVGARLLERLSFIKQPPLSIVDAGCGTGWLTHALAKTYPYAKIYGLDFAPSMIATAQSTPSAIHFLCADITEMPFADHSIDTIVSNLALQWTTPLKTLTEYKRVLKPGGTLLFATLGPGTLKELAAAWEKVDSFPHVHPFLDLHTVGDMLLAAGFHDPVMDMAPITLTYQNIKDLLWDLKTLGATNLHVDRRKSLTGKQRFHAMKTAYEAFRRKDGLPATYEVTFGYAVGPEVRESEEERYRIASRMVV